jgi:hypothetical protein
LDPAFFRRSVSEVRDVGTRIDALLSRGELRSLRETAETLHRVSGHIGLTKITELSEDVLALLDDPRASKAVVRDFAMRLSRACARTRAAA